MKILIICHRLPFISTTGAFSFRVLDGIKYLSDKYAHDITLVGFKYRDDPSPDTYLRKYCNQIVAIEIPSLANERRLYYLINHVLSLSLFAIPPRDALNYPFLSEMKNKVSELLKIKEFDVVFVDEPSILYYASNINLPKVIETWCASRMYNDAYSCEKNIFKKLNFQLRYLISKNKEKIFEKFDICITPTEQERDILLSYFPHLDISVVPFGTETNLGSEGFEQDFPSLLFLGSLDSIFNQESIFYLYNEIYPLIKEKNPNIRLYIVGRNPSKGILNLAVDSSVIVTGYVEDIRPYLARASVITLPVHGYGIKTRLLEAMAMGKPVVTSSAGIHGIDVTPGEDVFISDNPNEFAGYVIDLLNDVELRKKIGYNARKLMEEKYSWEKMTDNLNEVLQKAVNKYDWK